MKKKKSKELKNVKFSILYALVALFVFGAIIYRVYYITTSKEIDGINIQKFASNRTTKKEILPSKRVFSLNFLNTNCNIDIILLTILITIELFCFSVWSFSLKKPFRMALFEIRFLIPAFIQTNNLYKKLSLIKFKLCHLFL